MVLIKTARVILLLCFLAGCTKGRLDYITTDGQHKVACETEYTWAPSVDKYAVEYVLSYCAKRAQAKGYQVLDETLLTLDTSLPNAPLGEIWSHALAKELYDNDNLTDKEYGYLIAYLDLEQIKIGK